MKRSGFSLVEVLVTICLAAIILAVGVPSYQSVMRSSDMFANSSDMVTTLNYARVEAIKRGTSVQLSPQSGTDWTTGTVVWVDSDDDDTLDSGEALRLSDEFDSSSSVVSANSRSNFVFNAAGEVNNSDELTLCDDRTGEVGRVISILISGAIYSQKVTCG